MSFVSPGTYILRLTANDSQLQSADDVQITMSAGSDSDGDGMPDTWETTYGLNPYFAGDASQDPDKDGLTNASEATWGTNPLVRDTDGDWFSDGFEVNTNGTNPLTGDTDGDTMDDRWESMYNTGPTDPNSGSYDPDGDGYTNLQEYQNGTHPQVANP